MASDRSEKVAATLKKTVSEIIQNELKDPRIGFITVTEVKVSKDLRHVKIFFTALGTEKEKKSAQIGLRQATGFVRRLIADRVNFRFVPTIVFVYDETYEYGMHINELLDRIKKEEEKRNEQNRQDNQGT
ncbi:MAG: 30S ribosome-binding factor RbfA [Candidatus Omnitrophica bacterium]|nr:30S ribosome-binding factor RbfA [Candidatus Omnitrophota bacterium]